MKTAVSPALARTAEALVQLGDRLRLARLRRGLQVETIAAAAGISRVTLFRVEKGAPSVAMGAYASVLEVLGLQDDLDLVAADDAQGRQLQDHEMRRRRTTAHREGAEGAQVRVEAAEAMWAFKRRNQADDLERVRQGIASPAAMSWFSEEKAAKAQILGEAL